MIERVNLYKLKQKFKAPFVTSYAELIEKDTYIIEMISGSISGWGEAPALPFPYYSAEDSTTISHILTQYLCPKLLGLKPEIHDNLSFLFDPIIGNNIAKSGVEAAFLDLKAKLNNLPLYRYIGGIKNQIECGIVLPINSDKSALMAEIEKFNEDGYRRIKLKVSNLESLIIIEELNKRFPHVQFAIDANTAFKKYSIQELLNLDRYCLSMIEQPLTAKDLIKHAELQYYLKTPICLDEGIEDALDLKNALALKACKVINIKPARVGGILAAKNIHDLAWNNGIKVLCGGMFETGIGRAHNLALSTLPNFSYPADISESGRHFIEEIVEPAHKFSSPGIFTLSEKSGIGVEVLKSELEQNSQIISFKA